MTPNPTPTEPAPLTPEELEPYSPKLIEKVRAQIQEAYDRPDVDSVSMKIELLTPVAVWLTAVLGLICLLLLVAVACLLLVYLLRVLWECVLGIALNNWKLADAFIAFNRSRR